MKSIRKAGISGKKVLVRADLDVPLKTVTRYPLPVTRVLDDFRIRMCVPTLEYLINEGAKIIICGHLGRPGGEVLEELRLDPVGEILSEHLGIRVQLGFGDLNPKGLVDKMEGGDILLLENLRFEPGEEANDPEFAEKLASLADVYVNECFATSHRGHASIVGVSRLLPAYAGLRLEEEIKTLSKIRKNPKRPLVFIIGGAKTETKSPLVRKISKYADKILLGGKLMFDTSLESIPNVVFPIDAVDAYDIGPKTIELFKGILSEAGTVVWVGPLGKFEDAEYAGGTRIIAGFLTQIDADTIVGGGDTLAALRQFGLRDEMGFVSTGGGAMLAFLAGEELVGLVAID